MWELISGSLVLQATFSGVLAVREKPNWVGHQQVAV
jgi:hypothetical protein